MDWPDGAKYCVHIFEGSVGSPTLVYRGFQETLRSNKGPVKLRKSKVRGWWQAIGFGGKWWAKAHDCAFDCEANWPESGWKVAA